MIGIKVRSRIGTINRWLSPVTPGYPPVVSAYGLSSENAYTSTSVTFRSGAETSQELADPDYDYWKRGATELGALVTVPSGL